jgi:ubiquinone/menaquinone biosynthesis C-methylase UbiE
MSVRLVCPRCKKALDDTQQGLKCPGCGNCYPVIDAIPTFIHEGQNVELYSEWWHQKYEESLHARLAACWRIYRERLLRKKWLRPFLSAVLYFDVRRDLFFRKVFENYNASKKETLILDLACGKGRRCFAEYGHVVGVDLSFEPLPSASAIYGQVIHADALELPFDDQTFDFVVSSDFLGHIPSELKPQLLSEIFRVLKPGGITAHIMETDSTSFIYRFAKKEPVLFHRYFVEEIGGHFGLELPSAALKRFSEIGFATLYVKKIAPIWENLKNIRIYDNEYKTKSVLLKMWLFLCRAFKRLGAGQRLLEIVTGLASRIWARFIPLDSADALLVALRKPATPRRQ